MCRLQTCTSSPRTFWSAPVSRFGSFDFTRVTGVHAMTHRVFPLARSLGAAPRRRCFSACSTPLRYQRRMTPMRRGGQERLGHHDHSCLTTFTSHLEAVGSSATLGATRGVGSPGHPPLPFSDPRPGPVTCFSGTLPDGLARNGMAWLFYGVHPSRSSGQRHLGGGRVGPAGQRTPCDRTPAVGGWPQRR